MGKTMKDYFRDRIPIPKPGRPIHTEREYNRKRDKKVDIPDSEEEEND